MSDAASAVRWRNDGRARICFIGVSAIVETVGAAETVVAGCVPSAGVASLLIWLTRLFFCVFYYYFFKIFFLVVIPPRSTGVASGPWWTVVDGWHTRNRSPMNVVNS